MPVGRARTAAACRASTSSPRIDGPSAARHRLRRPLPDPSLGPADADRGDDGGAARRRQGGQGALHRRQQHVRLAVREGPVRRRPRRDWTRFVSMQNHYNLVYREEEREMIPQCIDQGVGVIPWSPLARGLLAGNRTRGARRNDTALRPTRSPTPLQPADGLRRRRPGRRGRRATAACRRRRSRWPGCCTVRA